MSSLWMVVDGGGVMRWILKLLFLIQKLLKFIIFSIITLFYQILMYNIGVS